MLPEKTISDNHICNTTSVCLFTVDIVTLQNPTTAAKKVHSSLQSTEYFIVSHCRAALTSDPHTSVGISIDLVLDKLPSTLNQRILSHKHK